MCQLKCFLHHLTEAQNSEKAEVASSSRQCSQTDAARNGPTDAGFPAGLARENLSTVGSLLGDKLNNFVSRRAGPPET
ncbi:hypothetical protein TNCV_4828781 [Trichonephila clavipes]|nr:hypothetical protein TNCV_4828781 [Trichonephila clavipes]